MTLSSEPVLRLRHVSAIFPDREEDFHALTDVSFDVYPQEFVCILGPSASGKSTLLRIISGLLQPSKGEVIFEGKKVLEPHAKIGLVFQNPNLMPWRSVIENVMLPLELQGMDVSAARKHAEELLRLVRLGDFADWLPRDLSGGMAQRVAIARSLVHDPDLLLLDEPFGALDALTRERMALELLRIWEARRKTVIMVTHSISEALFLADRVLVLTPQPGRIKLDMQIGLPRPREEDLRYQPKFARLAKRLRMAIE